MSENVSYAVRGEKHADAQPSSHATAVRKEIRVLVGEQYEIIRRGLSEILNEQTGMRVFAEASSFGDLLSKVRKDPPDLVIIGLSMPGKHALDIVKDLKSEFPHLPIILMGGKSSDIHVAARAMKAGAAAFLSTKTPAREVIHAVKLTLRGERYVNAETAQILALETFISGNPTPDVLSDRELQVLCMIASGTTTRDISRDLGISPVTVSTYRQRILEKMRMKHNAELVRYAIENKLIEMD